MEIFEARVLGENLSFWLKNHQFPPKPLLQIFPCKNPSRIMIITSHMQKIIQIHPCLLKLSRKQESVTDGRTDRQTNSRYYYIPRRYRWKYLKQGNRGKILVFG
jgi:hypothetical protein